MPDQMGRLSTPDWTADDPGVAFVRGFGKVATRNSQSFGLLGERAFADFNNAARVPETLFYTQNGWPGVMRVELRFRRLYFDGKLAGRFEFGFLIPEDVEGRVSIELPDFFYDVGKLTAAVLNISVSVVSMEGATMAAKIGNCARPLGLAYIMATTKKADLARFPATETYGAACALGDPMIHVRVSQDHKVAETRDRRDLEGSEGKIFITSAERVAIRNNVVVQLSPYRVLEESPQERAIRVLFSHMNSLLFAKSISSVCMIN